MGGNHKNCIETVKENHTEQKVTEPTAVICMEMMTGNHTKATTWNYAETVATTENYIEPIAANHTEATMVTQTVNLSDTVAENRTISV